MAAYRRIFNRWKAEKFPNRTKIDTDEIRDMYETFKETEEYLIMKRKVEEEEGIVRTNYSKEEIRSIWNENRRLREEIRRLREENTKLLKNQFCILDFKRKRKKDLDELTKRVSSSSFNNYYYCHYRYHRWSHQH